MTFSAHKQFSVVDTHQTNCKMLKKHLMLKREVCPSTHRCTYLGVELVSLSRRMFPLHQGNVHVCSRCQAQETDLDPWNKWYPPKPPLGASGPWAVSSSQPSWPSWPRSDRGKCWETSIARAQPHVGHQSLLAKVGPAALHLKANKEPRLMERKVRFILQASNLVGTANSCPKADFPHLTLPPTVSRKEIL